MNQKPDTDIRPPIVTLMGHVDHGKTTLLDTIRRTNVVATEHGGITQHIGAYQIIFQDKPITFIDTPGHAAFEKMRSRGAEVADIVILVVAANDGVKPQTIEAIKHIKKADKPSIVAITKTDLPDINIDRIKKQLQDQNIILESFGGQVLEVVLLVWQLSPQPYLPEDPLEAVVVESFLDKKRGPVVTVIVKKGTLAVGQKITVDSEIITVRALIDEKDQNVDKAQPGKPVEILGFKKIFDIGGIVSDLTLTKSKAGQPAKTIDDIIAKSEEAKESFKVVIKADVAGSLEAIMSNLPKNLLVVSSGLGEVKSGDIVVAKLANAPTLAFNLKINGQIKSQAEREGVVIKNYNVIYELLSDMQDVVALYEQAKHELKIIGRAKVVATFDVDGKKIAGAKVTHGRLKIGDQILLKRDNLKQEAKIVSLKRFKKDLEQVTNGQDCGIGINPSLDVRIGDIIESLG